VAEEEEGDGDGNGKGCEGGYRLSESPITVPGPGSQEKAEIGGGWVRYAGAQGHYYYHKDHGWHDWETAEKQVKEGITPKFRANVCPKDHELKVIDGKEWCCPSTEGYGAQPTTEGGEFKFSPDLTAAIRSMLERYEEILDRPYGLTDEERQDIINYALKGVRGGERGLKQSKIDQLARMGLAGQPVELSEIGKIERGTREAEADVRSKIGLGEIDRKMQDFLSTTSMAGSILELLMETEQLPEILSAGRRREGLDWTSLLTNYLGMQMGQQNPYWQSLFSMLNQGGGGGDIMDWLPYLGYYFGDRIQRR